MGIITIGLTKKRLKFRQNKKLVEGNITELVRSEFRNKFPQTTSYSVSVEKILALRTSAKKEKKMSYGIQQIDPI